MGVITVREGGDDDYSYQKHIPIVVIIDLLPIAPTQQVLFDTLWNFFNVQTVKSPDKIEALEYKRECA